MTHFICSELEINEMVENAEDLIIEAYQEKWEITILLDTEKFEIKKYHYAGGGISFPAENIAEIAHVTSQDKEGVVDWLRNELEEDELELCDKKGWLSVWEGTKEEFTIEDARQDILESYKIDKSIRRALLNEEPMCCESYMDSSPDGDPQCMNCGKIIYLDDIEDVDSVVV